MKTQKKINDIQELINENVEKHLAIANEEMGVIKNDIGMVKEDIAEIKAHVNWIRQVYGDWEKRWTGLDNRVWAIMGTVILGTLLSIAVNLYFK